MPLDERRLLREAPIPLYVQIRDRLVAAIKEGDLAPGDRIPSEPELVRTFRVGRPTVRQAVALLRQEGWVVTHRGLGTFAAGASAEISLLSFDGLTQVLRAQGLSLRDTTLSSEEADLPALEVLTADDAGPWWIVRRLRHLIRGDHDEPLCVETDSFPLTVCPDAREIFARTGSATAVLQEAYGYEIDACDVASRAVRVPQRWRGALEVAAGAPVLAVEPEAQILEDVACLVFLRHYALGFAAKHPVEKVLDILVKTQRKMSPQGRAAALDFGLPAPVLALYERALRALDTAPERKEVQ